ncbi:hypothetical protein B1218_35935, partial [Pseudomonas ogarae]
MGEGQFEERIGGTELSKAKTYAVGTVKSGSCFKGCYRIERVNVRQELLAGGMRREVSSELFGRHDAVCVRPCDPQRDEGLLI